jgi:hypothetical protein
MNENISVLLICKHVIISEQEKAVRIQEVRVGSSKATGSSTP